MDDDAPLIALAEVNRLRIVELLGAAPRAVGEIADALGIRQPQVTKHLQTLERAGLVAVHPLGRRRIYSLQREPLRAIRGWLEQFEAEAPSSDALIEYQASVAALERAAAAGDDGVGRTLSLRQRVDAPPSEVWRWFTTPHLARRFWAPDHFTVTDCELDPVVGGAMTITFAEGDGTRYPSTGRYLALDEPRELRFAQSPQLPDGSPLLTSEQTVRFAPVGDAATELAVELVVTQASAHAAPALAGMEPGWRMVLAGLAREVAVDAGRPRPEREAAS